MFKDTLLLINKTFDGFNSDKNNLLQKYISYKLDRTQNSYFNMITKNYNYILTRSNEKIMKALLRKQKKEEKEELLNGTK